MKLVNPAGKDLVSNDSFKAYRTCICSVEAMDGHDVAQYSGPGNSCATCNFNCKDDSGPNTNHSANYSMSLQRNKV